ncbi:MAG TPA: heme o synthase [Candidatus Sulfotelmatobacter sp.]|nr:heme o synthase [Candidatus Sulfotelmatobacter sp.]
MNAGGEAVGSTPAGPGRRPADFLALMKPRVVLMVLVTAAVGFYLGSPGRPDLLRLLHTLLGTALAAAGTIALNQYLERDGDALMERTRLRPLPAGRLRPIEALAFGVAITAAGLAYTVLAVDARTAMVTAVTAGSYLFLYTPLKRVSTLCTFAGAISGGLPPVTGWVAARGEFGPGAWTLFAILFLWQIPHSLAIARLYREDYGRAGIHLLPVVDPDGASTGRHVLSHCLALLAVGLLPTFLGLTGPLYFMAALGMGAAFLACGIALARSCTREAARRLVLVSLVYLPALLGFMAVDKVTF